MVFSLFYRVNCPNQTYGKPNIKGMISFHAFNLLVVADGEMGRRVNRYLSDSKKMQLFMINSLSRPTSNSRGYVAGSCKYLKSLGLSRFTPREPNFTSRRDRDNDGVACEIWVVHHSFLEVVLVKILKQHKI